MTCKHCVGARKIFSERTARKDLKRYLRKGPRRTTRALIEALLQPGGSDAVDGEPTLIDIGGGVSAIPFELLADGVHSAVAVDASEAYLAVARKEAERRGVTDRLEFRLGDFVDLAPDLDSADLVSLDRVICCYPDVRALLAAAGGRARKRLALVAPADYWWFRPFFRLANLYCVVTRNPFRLFAHSWATVDSVLAEAGMEPVGSPVGLLWRVAAYERTH